MEYKLTYSIQEAVEQLPFSHDTLYRMAGRGEIEIRRIGRKSFITGAELRRLIEGASSYAKGFRPGSERGAA